MFWGSGRSREVVGVAMIRLSFACRMRWCQPRRDERVPLHCRKIIQRAAQYTRIMACALQDVKQKSSCKSVEKNYLVDLAEKRSKARRTNKDREN
jgi:hypothetical protein